MAAFPHPARPDPPHSGVVRTVYFLAVAVAAIFVAITAVVGFYEPPAGDTALPSGFEESSIASGAQHEKEDYNRNVTLILSAVSAAAFAAVILGLGSRFNPLRAGVILGALIIFLVAMGFWASSGEPADISPSPTSPPPRSDFEPASPAPEAPEPPPARTEPPPPMSALPRE